MKTGTMLLSTVVILAISNTSVFAAAGAPIKHSHDGRSHTHPLPATGKNHTHGNKPAPKEKTPKKHGWYNVGVSSSDGSIVRLKFYTDKVISGKIQALFEWDETEGKSLYEYAVNVADCDTGYGALYRRNLGETRFNAVSSGWVEGGSSLGSGIGSVLCEALDVNHK